jgi:hypothetical protein
MGTPVNDGEIRPGGMGAADNPWRFLSALDGGEAVDRDLILKTRGDEIQLVSHMVAASRASILYAFSGNGKSSLINAGLVPFFVQNRYAVFRVRPRPPWCIDNPTQAFKTSIVRDVNLPLFREDDIDTLKAARRGLDSTGAARIDDLIARLKQQNMVGASNVDETQRFREHLQGQTHLPLAEFIAAIQARLDSATEIVFVCDQFEELFVHFGNTPEMDVFVKELGDVWADSALRVRFLFSMREDWVGSMIEFRKAIPDIFSNYFKLDPIRRSRAADILKLPLRSVRIDMRDDVITRILDDLANVYVATQEARYGEVSLTRSPKNDPYIEVPALQIIAEALWSTKDQARAPFSSAHYESLRGVAPSRDQSSPSEAVLGSYLDDLLTNIDDSEDLSATQWKQLRLDCLYLLTDRARHRRALPAGRLIEELKQIRPQGLDLPEIEQTRLRKALEPLERVRLVRSESTRGGERQFELAHDFAVRSVVSGWRALDRQRTAEAALLSRARDERDVQFGALDKTDRQLLRFLELGPLAGFALLAVCLITSIYGRTGPLAIAAIVAFAVVFFVGALRRLPWSMVLGGSGTLGAVGVTYVVPSFSSFSISWAALLYLLVPLYLKSGHTVAELLSAPNAQRTFARLWAEFLCLSKGAAVVGATAAFINILYAETPLSYEDATNQGVIFGLLMFMSLLVVAARQMARRGAGFGTRWTGLIYVGPGSEPLGFGRSLAHELARYVWLASLVVASALFTVDSFGNVDTGLVAWALTASTLWAVAGVWLPGWNKDGRHVYDLVTGVYPRTGAASEPQRPAASTVTESETLAATHPRERVGRMLFALGSAVTALWLFSFPPLLGIPTAARLAFAVLLLVGSLGALFERARRRSLVGLAVVLVLFSLLELWSIALTFAATQVEILRLTGPLGTVMLASIAFAYWACRDNPRRLDLARVVFGTTLAAAAVSSLFGVWGGYQTGYFFDVSFFVLARFIEIGLGIALVARRAAPIAAFALIVLAVPLTAIEFLGDIRYHEFVLSYFGYPQYPGYLSTVLLLSSDACLIGGAWLWVKPPRFLHSKAAATP